MDREMCKICGARNLNPDLNLRKVMGARSFAARIMNVKIEMDEIEGARAAEIGECKMDGAG